jgi:hypothetical protein
MHAALKRKMGKASVPTKFISTSEISPCGGHGAKCAFAHPLRETLLCIGNHFSH